MVYDGWSPLKSEKSEDGFLEFFVYLSRRKVVLSSGGFILEDMGRIKSRTCNSFWTHFAFPFWCEALKKSSCQIFWFPARNIHV
jgi:hypothetical protein